MPASLIIYDPDENSYRGRVTKVCVGDRMTVELAGKPLARSTCASAPSGPQLILGAQ